MSNTEFIDQWNNFISYKLCDNDLSRPTEHFLINALLAYLMKLNINFAPHVQCEIVEQKRTGKIKLVHYINSLYKMSSKNNEFSYFDLLHPAPKKTTHMLKIILNYLIYYNMEKTAILDKASQRLAEHTKLISEKKKVELENIAAIERANTINQQSDEFKQLQPKFTAECNQLETEMLKLHTEENELETQCNNLEYNITQMANKRECLKSEIVSESERNHLVEKQRTIEKSLEEHKEKENAGSEYNSDIASAMPNLELNIQKLDHIMEQLLIMEQDDKTNEYEQLSTECNKNLRETYQCMESEKKNLTEMIGQIEVESNKKTEETNVCVQNITKELELTEKEYNCVNDKLIKIRNRYDQLSEELKTSQKSHAVMKKVQQQFADYTTKIHKS